MYSIRCSIFFMSEMGDLCPYCIFAFISSALFVLFRRPARCLLVLIHFKLKMALSISSEPALIILCLSIDFEWRNLFQEYEIAPWFCMVDMLGWCCPTHIRDVPGRRKLQWIGHTSNFNVCYARQWVPLAQDGRRAGSHKGTRRRTVEKEYECFSRS